MANRTCGLKSPFPENPYLLTDLFSESLKIPVFYRSILVKFYFSLNFILNLIFNKFNSIFRAGIHAVSTLYAVFRAGYNCPFYSIDFLDIKNFCRTNLIAGKSSGTFFMTPILE
jgi:hypothetical protein